MKKLLYFFACCCLLMSVSGCQTLLRFLPDKSKSAKQTSSAVSDHKVTTGYVCIDSVLQIRPETEIKEDVQLCLQNLDSMQGVKTEFCADGFAVKATLSASELFVPNSSSLSDDGERLLASFADSVKSIGKLSVWILGFTDNQVAPYIGIPLSTKRAQSVKTFLSRHESSLSGVWSKGLGSANPVGDNATDDGRSKNRRIEIYLLPVRNENKSK